MSAVTEVRLAMDTALLGHAPLMALIDGRIVDGRAPEGFPTPYLRYSSSSEAYRRRLGGAEVGEGDELLNVFDSSEDTTMVRSVYVAVRDALHLKKLPLGDGRHVVGRVTLVSAGPDERSGTMAAIRYEPRVASV